MHFWGMHLFWWLFWVLLIVGFFVMLEPVPRRRGRGSAIHRETPLDVLQRRYANGEMTTEEYEERKSVIERDAGAASHGA